MLAPAMKQGNTWGSHKSRFRKRKEGKMVEKYSKGYYSHLIKHHAAKNERQLYHKTAMFPELYNLLSSNHRFYKEHNQWSADDIPEAEWGKYGLWHPWSSSYDLLDSKVLTPLLWHVEILAFSPQKMQKEEFIAIFWTINDPPRLQALMKQKKKKVHVGKFHGFKKHFP